MARTEQHPWVCPGWKILPTRIGYCSNAYCDRRFRCEDNNVAFTNVQPHYYRVRQVEPCHQLGWTSQALILSISALGAMPNQQQQQHWVTLSAKPAISKHMRTHCKAFPAFLECSTCLCSIIAMVLGHSSHFKRYFGLEMETRVCHFKIDQKDWYSITRLLIGKYLLFQNWFLTDVITHWTEIISF